MKALIFSIIILLVSLVFTKNKETYRDNCPAAVAVKCPDKKKLCGSLTCPEPKCPELNCPGPNFPELNCPELKCPEPKCPELTCPEPYCPEQKCPEILCPEPKCPEIKCPELKCKENKCPEPKCPEIKFPELKCPACPECPEPKWPERKCPEPSNLTDSTPSLVPNKNTCNKDIKTTEPESIKLLNKNFEKFEESYRSTGSREKGNIFTSSSYLTITVIMITIKSMLSSDDDVFNHLKNNGVCNTSPFFNEEEINYINNFIDKIIMPLRKDEIFKGIIKKICDSILENTKRVCSISNITCNF
jgi:hypothetical protein